jgi:hypothetical protein
VSAGFVYVAWPVSWFLWTDRPAGFFILGADYKELAQPSVGLARLRSLGRLEGQAGVQFHAEAEFLLLWESYDFAVFGLLLIRQGSHPTQENL